MISRLYQGVSRATLYGLSARGLAVGTGGPEPEEFPTFTAFWVYEPQPGDTVVITKYWREPA